MAHKESCKKCKDVFHRALKKEFGEVIKEWKSGWPCRIDDILTLSGLNKTTANSLKKIYAALQSHRGYQDFVRRRKLTACDYYVKSLNCLIEFDESQHFTAPRALTLSLYPRNLKNGFNNKMWRKRCLDMDRHDNDPAFRDETRAWYDTLRDILPICFGMNPTVRIFAKEAILCENENITRGIIQNIFERRR